MSPPNVRLFPGGLTYVEMEDFHLELWYFTGAIDQSLDAALIAFRYNGPLLNKPVFLRCEKRGRSTYLPPRSRKVEPEQFDYQLQYILNNY